MFQIPIFITLTGQQTNQKVRVNINNITKYRPNEGNGTSIFTCMDNGNPYMKVIENVDTIDNLIKEATEDILNLSKPQQYTLRP